MSEERLARIEQSAEVAHKEMLAHQLNDTIEFAKATRERSDMRQDVAVAAETMKNVRHQLLDEKEGILPRIERQTMKTNGRVSKLERWQSYVIGFCACLSLLVIVIGVPILIELIRVGKL